MAMIPLDPMWTVRGVMLDVLGAGIVEEPAGAEGRQMGLPFSTVTVPRTDRIAYHAHLSSDRGKEPNDSVVRGYATRQQANQGHFERMDPGTCATDARE